MLGPHLAELQCLIAGLCERTLSREEKARLEELVSTDKECCEYYVEAMHVEAALPRYAGTAVRSAAAIIAQWQAEHASTHDSVLNAVASCQVGDADINNPTADEHDGPPSRTSPPSSRFAIQIDPTAGPIRRRFTQPGWSGSFLRGNAGMSRAVAVLFGTLCTGFLTGGLAVKAVSQMAGSEAPQRRGSEMTLLGSTGSGFTTALFHSANHGSIDPKSDASAIPAIAPRDYVHTVSNEAFNLFSAVPKRTVWQLRFTGGLLDSEPGNRRVALGLRNGATPAANLFLPGSGDESQAGLWVFLTNGINITPYTIRLGKHGNLVFVNNAGEAILLATWDWAQFDMSAHANITVSLDTSATHYSLVLDQGVTNVTGSLSGALPSAAPVSVRIGVFDQIGDGVVPGSATVDRIAISDVPTNDFPRLDDGALGAPDSGNSRPSDVSPSRTD